MPELVIKYKNKRTLEALKDFAKYFEFSMELPANANKTKIAGINGVTILPADSSVDTSDLEAIFSGKQIDSKKLRNNSWQRSK